MTEAAVTEERDTGGAWRALLAEDSQEMRAGTKDVKVLDTTPRAFLRMGVPDLPWYTSREHLVKELMPQEAGGHGVGRAELARLPELLADPVAVFLTRGEGEGEEPCTIGVALDAVNDRKQPLVAFVALDGYATSSGVWEPCIYVKSVHGRANFLGMMYAVSKNAAFVTLDTLRLLRQLSRTGASNPMFLEHVRGSQWVPRRLLERAARLRARYARQAGEPEPHATQADPPEGREPAPGPVPEKAAFPATDVPGPDAGAPASHDDASTGPAPSAPRETLADRVAGPTRDVESPGPEGPASDADVPTDPWAGSKNISELCSELDVTYVRLRSMIARAGLMGGPHMRKEGRSIVLDLTAQAAVMEQLRSGAPRRGRPPREPRGPEDARAEVPAPVATAGSSPMAERAILEAQVRMTREVMDAWDAFCESVRSSQERCLREQERALAALGPGAADDAAGGA